MTDITLSQTPNPTVKSSNSAGEAALFCCSVDSWHWKSTSPELCCTGSPSSMGITQHLPSKTELQTRTFILRHYGRKAWASECLAVTVTSTFWSQKGKINCITCNCTSDTSYVGKLMEKKSLKPFWRQILSEVSASNENWGSTLV